MNGEELKLSLHDPLVRLTRGDIDSIVDIEQRSFSHPWSRNSFLEELSRSDSYNYGIMFGHCQAKTHLIAYICYRLIQDEMHLLKIAVAPTWRSRGVASLLLRKRLRAEERRGAAASLLEVRPSNVSVIALYDRLGFQIIGKRPKYYADTREDALIMMKTLKERS
jgi:ribosomal-protein-alanine N-acetyltransferase